ncbi:unnamed protein product [Haemonchus placei]|uniref:SDR family NAD(P)-dependent oxidoreductase n=1 Tax=Haemonchus placei TaxID=6290 RepID=A0A158QRE8_HAEPC|nr:unnamed protein product [Haemonchus placei]
MLTCCHYRRYFKGAHFDDMHEQVSAKGLVAVVTGANSGIGLQTVRGLNLAKAKVYMLCRNEERGVAAKIKLAQMGCDATRLVNLRCDLANFSSVRECANEILKEEDKIDILINNAGVMFYPRYEKTVDGHEMTWQSNHLGGILWMIYKNNRRGLLAGHFLLTHLLLPAMEKAPKARIVIVSSKLHLRSKALDLATIDDEKKFGYFEPYNRSKLANVMHARALTRRLHELGIHHVTANSLHPGVVNTNLSRSTPLLKTPLRQITAPFRWFFLKTESDGAQTSLYLALSKNVEGVSGKYFA